MITFNAVLQLLVAVLAPIAPALGLGCGMAQAAEAAHSNPIAEAFPLIFDSERIRIGVLDDSLEVRGTYVLLCRAGAARPIPLFYPFPHDSLMGGARMVSLLMRVGSGAPAPARWEDLRESGVRWWLPACSGDTVTVESIYRQKIATEYARYVVTTTQAWGRPLRLASFEIRLPPGAIPLEFSFPFEQHGTASETSYTYEARDFFPDRDIVVRWKH